MIQEDIDAISSNSDATGLDIDLSYQSADEREAFNAICKILNIDGRKILIRFVSRSNDDGSNPSSLVIMEDIDGHQASIAVNPGVRRLEIDRSENSRGLKFLRRQFSRVMEYPSDWQSVYRDFMKNEECQKGFLNALSVFTRSARQRTLPLLS